MSHHTVLVCHVIAAEFLWWFYFLQRNSYSVPSCRFCLWHCFLFFAKQPRFWFFCRGYPILFLAAAPITGHHLAANGNARWLTLMKEFPRKREHLQLDLLGMVHKWSILFQSDFKYLGTSKWFDVSHMLYSKGLQCPKHLILCLLLWTKRLRNNRYINQRYIGTCCHVLVVNAFLFQTSHPLASSCTMFLQ